MKKVLKVILIVLLAVIIIAGGYVGYVFLSFSRIADDLPLQVEGTGEADPLSLSDPLKIVSWNIGFGAYEADYDFFMDGGKQSWAVSKERLLSNLDRITERLTEQEADIYLIQEVDFDSTRSYHVDERVPLEQGLEGYSHIFAQNYNSPFLMYPFYQPHGASKAGIETFCCRTMTDGVRRSLPIENGMTKVLDLDRCYSVQSVPVENGAQLKIFNFHLSAYTSDGKIAYEQLQLLLTEMKEEYEKGNYCIAGGDFNKDILGDSSAYFGAADVDATWAQPLTGEFFEPYGMTLVAPLDEASPVPSCRNPDSAYHPGQFVVTVDGFIHSPNVELLSAEVLDYQFAYSDHNPVSMRFRLN